MIVLELNDLRSPFAVTSIKITFIQKQEEILDFSGFQVMYVKQMNFPVPVANQNVSCQSTIVMDIIIALMEVMK